MIKATHATLVALIPMLFLTWWFEGMMDEHWDKDIGYKNTLILWKKIVDILELIE